MSLCGQLPPSKRIRTIDANGVEEFHEHNKWIHLDLKAAAASAAEDGAAEAQDGKHAEAAKQDADAEEAPDRMKPFEALFAARVRLSSAYAKDVTYDFHHAHRTVRHARPTANDILDCRSVAN
jgi:hypothetical protein